MAQKFKPTSDITVATDLVGLTYLDIVQGAPHMSAIEIGAIFFSQAIAIYAKQYGPVIASTMMYAAVSSYLESYCKENKVSFPKAASNDNDPPKENA